MQNFFDLSFDALERQLADLDPRTFRSGQILRWVYTLGADNFMEMSDMPLALREELAQLWDLKPLEEVERTETGDGTVKFLHALEDGHTIESVLIPEGDHCTLCVSTQSGCAMACAFCETGMTDAGRNLTAGEILAQIVYAVRYTGHRLKVRNLVFMGMGEPLLNLESLLRALRVILSAKGLDFSSRRVTVSTCGWVPGIIRMAQEGPEINLAVSLNATDNRTRSRIMPVNRKFPIEELIKAVRKFPVKTRKKITFEYVLIDGLNDTPEDARRLRGILRGLPAKVNLILCNENRSGYRAPSEAHARAFQEQLLEYGVLATVRKSRGSEIGAACGQLKAEVAGNRHG